MHCNLQFLYNKYKVVGRISGLRRADMWGVFFTTTIVFNLPGGGRFADLPKNPEYAGKCVLYISALERHAAQYPYDLP